jgi:phosphatidate cytidylyltransferase
MGLRIFTGVVLIVIVVALVWWGPPALLAAVAAAAILLALNEFFDLGERVGLHGFRKWTMVCVAALFFVQYQIGLVEVRSLGDATLLRESRLSFLTLDLILLIFIFGVVTIALAMRRPLQEALGAVSISAAGILVVALPFSYLIRINEIENDGRLLVLFTLCLVWAGDTFAYFIGKFLGRLPMAPALSPKKTWEGAFANVLGSLLVAAAFARWIRIDLTTLLLIAGVANVAGQAGDLVESAYKRGASVKDSSSLLPGHGGMLDRIDSLILAAPVVWFAWLWFGQK